MNEQYLPQDPAGRIARLIEECGEVMQAIGKAGRFGFESRHPNGGPTNAQQLLTELWDLEHAIDAVKRDLIDRQSHLIDAVIKPSPALNIA